MTTSMTQRSLADIVATQPAAARVFDTAGLDYCCHGEIDLATACTEAGVDLEELVRNLADVQPTPGEDWTALAPPDLAAHVVATHHRFLWDELPALEALADKVAGVHGCRHPELVDVLRLVRELRTDLEPHMRKEEMVLFPSIHELFGDGRHDFPFGTIRNPIQVMVAEHDRAGELLATLREVTGRFAVPSDGCASYRALYNRLEAVEHDTHVHIHKENHVLFPAALRAEAQLTGCER